MRDVAELAGVGLATVSRVVNHHHQVSPATAERVRAAIKQLDFHRDDLARSLRAGQRSTSLALLLGDLTNPFYASIAAGAMRVAQARGYALIIGAVDEDPQAERRLVGELISRRIAGLILVPGQGDHSFLHDICADLPVVFADRPGQGFAADTVLVDNERGAYLATRHLLEGGHERIAALVAPAYYTTGRRLRGYRRALREAGKPIDPQLVRRLANGSARAAEQAMAALLGSPQPPDAIFTTTNFLTEGAVRALRHRGQQLALVGFDDFRAADLLPSPATVVAVDAEELGRVAMQNLLQRIDEPDAPVRRVVCTPQLIVRGSGEVRQPRTGRSKASARVVTPS